MMNIEYKHFEDFKQMNNACTAESVHSTKKKKKNYENCTDEKSIKKNDVKLPNFSTHRLISKRNYQIDSNKTAENYTVEFEIANKMMY